MTIDMKYIMDYWSSDNYLSDRLPRVDDLKEQVYEVDTDIEQGDLVSWFQYFVVVMFWSIGRLKS